MQISQLFLVTRHPTRLLYVAVPNSHLSEFIISTQRSSSSFAFLSFRLERYIISKQLNNFVQIFFNLFFLLNLLIALLTLKKITRKLSHSLCLFTIIPLLKVLTKNNDRDFNIFISICVSTIISFVYPSKTKFEHHSNCVVGN